MHRATPMRVAAALPAFLVLATGGCAAESGDPCDDARATIEGCFGPEVAAGFTCDADAAADIAGQSCETLVDLEGKSDGFFCDKLGLFCPKPALFPEPTGEATRLPIVLAHGFNGSPENEWGVHPHIVSALRADGHPIYVARVAPIQSVEVRAAQLGEEVDRALAEFSADRVNLVAHSMGGLDARYLVSALGYGDRVASVTTISTPHRGSRIADVVLGLVGGPVESALDALAEAMAARYTTADLAEGSSLRAALSGIAEGSAADFNRRVADVDGVVYQSWAGVASVTGLENDDARAACSAGGGEYLVHPAGTDRLSPRLWPMAPFVAHGTDNRPHDGMVTVESARWGEFRGCIPADHYDEVGQIDAPTYQKRTGFDATAFYRHLAFDLAAQGL